MNVDIALTRQNDRQTEPTVDTLLDGGERLLAMAQEPDSSVETINECTVFLYGALSDIDTLVRTESEVTGINDDDHPIRDLKALVVKICRALRRSPTSQPQSGSFTRVTRR